MLQQAFGQNIKDVCEYLANPKSDKMADVTVSKDAMELAFKCWWSN